MANQKKTRANTRKKPGNGKPWLLLLAVVVVIAALFFILEKIKGKPAVSQKEKAPVVEQQKQPEPPSPAETPSVIQKPYSTAEVPPPPEPLPRGKKEKRRATGPGTVAIIIDDMGSSLQEAKSLLAMDIPVTFAVIPGLPKSRQVAEAAHAKGEEVMIHMPMQPKGYPGQRMESNGLLLAYENEEIVRRVSGYVQQVPFAVGANNHMGSQFTENGTKMRAVLSVLKDRGLFFVDSRTSPKSVGYSLAREMGLETATRSVFLDNVQDVAAIKRELEHVAAVARRSGSAIAICHPHPATIKALAATMPVLQGEGITFVHASRLVK